MNKPSIFIVSFVIGQFFMVTFFTYVGWTTNTINVILSVSGLYLSQNVYAYIFGTSEARAWAILLLLTSITLCILPLISGLTTRGIHVFLQRQTKRIWPVTARDACAWMLKALGNTESIWCAIAYLTTCFIHAGSGNYEKYSCSIPRSVPAHPRERPRWYREGRGIVDLEKS